LPMIRKLTEYSAVMTRIPASRPWTPIRVCSRPVSIPAAHPAAAPAKVAHIGWISAVRRTAATAAPRAKEPSVVRSLKSNSRNVMYTPSTIKARKIPMVAALMSRLMAPRLPRRRPRPLPRSRRA